SLRGIQNKQHIEQLKYDINLIANKSTIAKSDIKRIVQKIDFNLSQENEEWHDLQKHFNSIHSDFLNRMNNEFSPLTQTEIKHCCLIKLHLSTKEIARYLHISPRSVQASRYRIKKKLLLDESIDLKEFIINY
ncbi:LuxR C-terminal-related transcriptional regulator, partial [Flavobacteriaceae bacterium]|nr:LuxR C-terminal-related transcriptional regulator [Flavobacteriaceae bacterium]